MNSLEAETMMSLDKFIDQTGLSAIWRYRKKGRLATINICGRQYSLRSEIARFHARAAAGELAKPSNEPGKHILLVRANSIQEVAAPVMRSPRGLYCHYQNDSLLFGVGTRRVFSATAED